MTTEAVVLTRAEMRLEAVIQALRDEYAVAVEKKTKRIHVELFMHNGVLAEAFVEPKCPIDLQT